MIQMKTSKYGIEKNAIFGKSEKVRAYHYPPSRGNGRKKWYG
jgi:hypothetical protein